MAERPVPPFAIATMPVTFPAVPPMLRVLVETKVGAAVPPVAFARIVLAPAVAAYDVVLPTEVMTPERLALVVTVAALPPMESEEVATSRRAEPVAFEYKRRLPEMAERPVPPLAIATMPVTFPAVPPMLRVEVLMAVTLPVTPVLLPRSVLAAICGSCASVRAFVAMPMETFEPPIWYPSVPLVTERPFPTPRVEVATLANVFTPEKYGMLPMTAAVEVERPLKPMVAPLRVIGQVVEIASCLAFQVVALVMRLSASVPIQYGVKV